MNDLVHEGEILAACRALYPTTHSVLNIQAERTTPPVPGFTSLMLRVTVTARSTDRSDTEVKLIYKRPPVIPKQLEVMGCLALFDREVEFFRDAVPILKLRCPQLPLVTCYYSQAPTLILEDLNERSFSSVLPDVKVMGTSDVMTLSHVRLVVRSLARFHAASLGTDWPKHLPQLSRDVFFESETSQTWAAPKTRKICEILAIVMRQYLDPMRCSKHADWLLQGDSFFNELSKWARFVPGELNVLCHGDFHVNNLMFRHDEHGNPTEVKFVDLQVFRYAPASRDILYFLYTSTSRKFRLQHETEILKTYVEAFNAAVCTTPDLLTFETFLAEYEASRFFGLGTGITVRPLLLSESSLKIKEYTDDDFFEAMKSAFSAPVSKIEDRLRSSSQFREAMLELAEETISVLNTMNIL